MIESHSPSYITVHHRVDVSNRNNLPHLKTILPCDELTFTPSCNLEDSDIELLVQIPGASQIRSLTMKGFNNLTTNSFYLIHHTFTNLTSLRVRESRVSPESHLGTITQLFTSLKTLSYEKESVNLNEIHSLSRLRGTLTELKLRAFIGDEGAAALATALPDLTVLKIRGNAIYGEGALDIAYGFTSLTELDISWNFIDEKHLAMVVNSLPGLVSLKATQSGEGLSDDILVRISKRLTALTKLEFYSPRLTEAGTQFLSNLPLVKLHLFSNNIGGKTVKEIANISTLRSLALAPTHPANFIESVPAFSALTRLTINFEMHTDFSTTRAIAKHLTLLRNLDIRMFQIGMDHEELIEKIPTLTHLRMSRVLSRPSTQGRDISTCEYRGVSVTIEEYARGYFCNLSPHKK